MTTTDLTPDSQAPGSGDKAGPSRRTVLLTTGTVVAAAAVTAACGSSSDSGSAATSSTAGSGSGEGTGSGATVETADMSVGGGAILVDQKVVVTQPQAGVYKAFTAVCTHQGCVVSSINDNKIICACHGSEFSAEDGSVLKGPAQGPLAPRTATVSGDTVTVT
ncbi:MAG: Rieske (2Fe-2S) protein [Candidatus Nanopelagicales bacterium]|jgi:Rieske Fe-S protein